MTMFDRYYSKIYEKMKVIKDPELQKKAIAVVRNYERFKADNAPAITNSEAILSIYYCAHDKLESVLDFFNADKTQDSETAENLGYVIIAYKKRSDMLEDVMDVLRKYGGDTTRSIADAVGQQTFADKEVIDAFRREDTVNKLKKYEKLGLSINRPMVYDLVSLLKKDPALFDQALKTYSRQDVADTFKKWANIRTGIKNFMPYTIRETPDIFEDILDLLKKNYGNEGIAFEEIQNYFTNKKLSTDALAQIKMGRAL